MQEIIVNNIKDLKINLNLKRDKIYLENQDLINKMEKIYLLREFILNSNFNIDKNTKKINHIKKSFFSKIIYVFYIFRYGLSFLYSLFNFYKLIKLNNNKTYLKRK